jgi:hypothetical protein
MCAYCREEREKERRETKYSRQWERDRERIRREKENG